MKISTFRPYGLLLASLFFASGAIASTMAATPIRAATAASALALVTAGAGTAVNTATPPKFADASITVSATSASASLTGTGTGIGTGTEADAAPSSASTDEHATDWDTQNGHDEDADHDHDHDTTDDHGRHAWRKHHHSTGKHDNEVVNVGADSVLEAGKEADSVVSVFGNSRDEGTVHENVVSVFGNTYVDGKIGGDAVAVFGNVELGPHAQIGGDAVTVFGELRRDPAAIVHGDSRSVFAHDFTAPSGLRSWVEHCLKYGRPLSLAQGVGWAWGLALSLLALYLCIALLFRSGVERCVETFEGHPGHSLLAALLAVLLTPVLIVLLCVTVVGIAAVPFAVIGLVCVALFGKAVILAWLGGRVLRVRGGSAAAVATPHPALAVLVGGLITLALYLVPFFGFVVYKLLGFLGFGAVVYTAIIGLRARQTARNGGPHAAAAASATAGAAMAGPGQASDATDAAADAGATSAVTGESASPTGGIPPSESASPPDAVPPRAAVAPPSTVMSELPRAGFWIRMAALLLDVLLVGLVTHLLHSFSNGHLVLLAAYGAIMWKLRGSTVGGIVFDLRVVRLDGREMDWETSIIRALSCFLSLAVAGLGFFWIAFDPANQAWHDKIAGTVVVRVPKAMPGV